MKVTWSEQADDDLHRCVEYIAKDDPVAAFDMYELITLSVARNLPDNPYMGRAGHVGGTREWVAHKNYIVVYRVGVGEIIIISIHHVARLMPQSF